MRRFPRASGILLHPTCLPGRFGIGDLGPSAYQFIDWLASAKQSVWEVLPLGPTGRSNSPYQSFSAFAGNPILISPEKLVARGYLSSRDLDDVPEFSESKVDFDAVIPWKLGVLRKAYSSFRESTEYFEFETREGSWLEPYARFMALKKAHQGEHWLNWDRAKNPSENEVRWHKFLQFEFFRQWADLRWACGERGIRIMGDIPFGVEHDGADVWAAPQLFNLDKDGWPLTVSGVPPDYFSTDGQLWGNPTYRWEKLEQTGYQWFIDRIRTALESFDLVRLDHFRGYEACWEVPAGKTTAIHGKWVKGPGARLFQAALDQLGDLPIVAENLGMITKEVEDLRLQFSFPGMAVLQFAFGVDSHFRPHNFPQDSVAFTATHDNDTTVGWWKIDKHSTDTRSRKEAALERERARAYLGISDQDHIHWPCIRAVMTSVAETAMFPLQDILGLGSEARFNVPGVADGNWTWRYRSHQLDADLAGRLRFLTELSDR